MKRIALFLCILTMLYAIETEDRVRRYEEKQQDKQRIEEPINKRSQFTHRRNVIALIDEDFETGMPIEWTIIDGNDDGHTWTTGTSPDIYGHHPPDYGTAYAYYSDAAAGIGAPAGTEYLISPAVRCTYPGTLILAYSWGLQASYASYCAVHFRVYLGDAWSSWNQVASYNTMGNGIDTLSLGSYVDAESVQVQFTYSDPVGEWGWAFGIDNVSLNLKVRTQYVWDFETGWQGWTNTNGLTYPEAWGVRPSWLHPSNTPPIAGDSSLWIDGGAAVSTADTALSNTIIPPPNTRVLAYGYCNYSEAGSANNDLFVGLRYFVDGSWHTDELSHYPSGMLSGPAWESIDITAYGIAESLQVFFYYTDNNTLGRWACFDNVGIYAHDTGFHELHDVGCTEIISPPEGLHELGWYQVIGRIRNLGNSSESFNIRATVHDTTNWTTLFDQTTIIVDLPPGADTNITLGSVNFNYFSYFYTEVYTLLIGDENTANDTSVVYSRTDHGNVIFEMDIQAICNDNQLLGIEFDGARFYITGGNSGTDPNKVYVVDTAGILLRSFDQPSHATGWGWRDLAWDGVYSGPDRIDTLYASVNNNVDKFSIDLAGGNLIYHGSFPGVQNPNRALAYCPFGDWFFTANFSSSCYKFDKAGVVLQSVMNSYSMYGAACDTLSRRVYWHSQDDPGTGFNCQISRMDAYTMNFVGTPFGFLLPSGLTDGTAGGLCSRPVWPWGCVLYALVQGTPHDYIVGIPGGWADNKEAQSGNKEESAFGLSIVASMVTKGRMPIVYTTSIPGHCSIKLYDVAGRLVRKIAEDYEQAGTKNTYWDGRDAQGRMLSSGVYFMQLQAGDYSATKKIILLR